MLGIRPLSAPKKGIKIIEDVYIFLELPNLDSNIYILKNNLSAVKGNYELMVIDAGNALNSKNLINGMKEIGLDPEKITKIVVTHEHIDHLLGIYNIPELSNIKPEIYALGRTMETIKNGDMNAIIPRMLGIDLSAFGLEIKKLPVIELKEGDTLDFGGFNMKILYTPGHSLGSMTLYEKNNSILFCGDVVFCGGSFGRFDFPGGSISDLKKSIKRLMDYKVSILAPGHMNFSKQGTEEIKKSFMVLNSFY